MCGCGCVCVRVCDTSFDMVPEKVFEEFQVARGSFGRLLSASHPQRSQPSHFKAVFSIFHLEINKGQVPVTLNTCLFFHRREPADLVN